VALSCGVDVTAPGDETGTQPQNPQDDPDLDLDNAAKGEDSQRDKSLQDTFPASDPPAIGGATGPND
jgi:hypothetical protein